MLESALMHRPTVNMRLRMSFIKMPVSEKFYSLPCTILLLRTLQESTNALAKVQPTRKSSRCLIRLHSGWKVRLIWLRPLLMTLIRHLPHASGFPTVTARNSTPSAFAGLPLHLFVEFCANPPAHAARWLHGDRVYTPGNQYGTDVLAYGVTVSLKENIP